MKNVGKFVLAATLSGFVSGALAKDIIHDPEHYIIKAQHGKRWAKEDAEIDAKLAEVRKKTAANHLTLSTSSSTISALAKSACRISMSSAAIGGWFSETQKRS